MFGKSKCVKCNNKIKDSFDFCPHCGTDLRNPEKDMKDYGMFGKNDVMGAPLAGGIGGLGISERMINSLMKSLVNAIDKQMRAAEPELNAQVQNFPNGVRIKFGAPGQKKKKEVKKGITEEQLKRMAGLPRVEGKTNVRRLSDKVVYEIKTNGVESVDDVFVSRLESGYEIKAIGKKKVYVNSLPVNLPMKSYSITEDGLVVEFGLH